MNERAARVLAALSLILILAGAASAAAAATLDDRVYAVAQQLMCPVCQGQTVAESDATVSREMRAIIRRKLEAGETPDQIVQYFVRQFGSGILAEPPRRGASLVLYVGPLAALLLGFGIAAACIRRWVGPAAPAPAAGAPGPAPADLERLARDLAARDR